MTIDMSKYACKSSMEQVLERCKIAFLNYSGKELVFSRDFSTEEFASRREKLAKRIGRNAFALIQGGPVQAGFRASQDATFYYFSGLDVLQSFLLIEGETGTTTLFLPPRDNMEGEKNDRVGLEDVALVTQKTGIKNIKPIEELDEALSTVSKLFMPFAELESGGVTRFESKGCANSREADPWDATTPRHKNIIAKIKAINPAIDIEDASEHIGRLRRIKSDAEIEVLRQAGHLSALIMIESMKATRAGMCESELEAVAKYIYAAYGNCDLGYGVIAASGKRIVNGHYHFNNATLQDGEVVLMDCGPDMRHYSSDIARIWPVSGTYSEWHRKVYSLIVDYHKVLISKINPGVYAKDAYAEARAITRKEIVPKYFPNNDLPAPLDGMLTQGGPYNHCVGLSVHDFVGPWREEIIEENMVFVVDPMAMFPDVSQYIRVEDTIVVTSDGCERLTGAAPIDCDETEEVMKQPSKLFMPPPSTLV